MFYNNLKKLTKKEVEAISRSNKQIEASGKDYSLIFEGYFNGKEIYSKIAR